MDEPLSIDLVIGTFTVWSEGPIDLTPNAFKEAFEPEIAKALVPFGKGAQVQLRQIRREDSGIDLVLIAPGASLGAVRQLLRDSKFDESVGIVREQLLLLFAAKFNAQSQSQSQSIRVTFDPSNQLVIIVVEQMQEQQQIQQVRLQWAGGAFLAPIFIMEVVNFLKINHLNLLEIFMTSFQRWK